MSGNYSTNLQQACLAPWSRWNGSWNCMAAPAIPSVCRMRWRTWETPWSPVTSGSAQNKSFSSLSTAIRTAIRQSANSTAFSVKWDNCRRERQKIFPRKTCARRSRRLLPPNCQSTTKKNPRWKYQSNPRLSPVSLPLTKKRKNLSRSRSPTWIFSRVTASRKRRLDCSKLSCAVRRATRRRSRNCSTLSLARAMTGALPNSPRS